MGVYFDDGVFDEERLVYIRICHQLIQIDARSYYQFLLFHVLCTVSIKVYFCLLVVQSGEVTDMIAFFHNAQTLFGQWYGIQEIFQAYLLLDVVIIFGGQSGYEIF